MMRPSTSSSSSSNDPVPHTLRRLALAAPDAITAALCAAAWWAPHTVLPDLLRSMALAMLIEFLAIHAALLVPLAGLLARGPRQLSLALALAAALYALVALGASLALDSWWPSLLFAWLLVSRYVVPRWSGDHGQALVDPGALWVASMLLWIGLLVATLLVPLPSLGWDAAARQQLGLPGSGLWVEQPHRLLAFAALYFAALAVFKYVSSGTARAPSSRHGMAERRQAARAAGQRAMLERKRRLAQERSSANGGDAAHRRPDP